MFELSDFFYNPSAPMLFNSALFFALFVVFGAVYALIFERRALVFTWVLGFSWYFYYKSSGLFLGLFLLTLVKDYVLALYLARLQSRRARLSLLWLSILSSLGVLFYFKYTNFLILNFAQLMGQKFDPLELVLPIGISFYTFQSISYLSDVYLGRVEVSRNLAHYAFYMSFFPHMVAGPIVKANHFLPQLRAKFQIRPDWVWSGFWLILCGLFKKAVVADYIAQYPDLVFADPSHYTAWECLLAIYGYALQIYCDFSGYSDMAIGIARVLGFDLGRNFEHPYRALNLTDFWRRWHISLSSWLREYLYIPLGGNRKGKLRTYVHLFVTMLLGGLWHGASWNFVLWGGAHGLGLAVHKLFDGSSIAPTVRRIPYWNFWAWLLNFHVVVFLWVFFRAASWDQALQLLGQLFDSSWSLAYLIQLIQVREMWLALLLLGFAPHFMPAAWKERGEKLFVQGPWLFKWLAFMIVVQLVLQFRDENVQPFIYFQF